MTDCALARVAFSNLTASMAAPVYLATSIAEPRVQVHLYSLARKRFLNDLWVMDLSSLPQVPADVLTDLQCSLCWQGDLDVADFIEEEKDGGAPPLPRSESSSSQRRMSLIKAGQIATPWSKLQTKGSNVTPPPVLTASQQAVGPVGVLDTYSSSLIRTRWWYSVVRRRMCSSDTGLRLSPRPIRVSWSVLCVRVNDLEMTTLAQRSGDSIRPAEQFADLPKTKETFMSCTMYAKRFGSLYLADEIGATSSPVVGTAFTLLSRSNPWSADLLSSCLLPDGARQSATE